MSAEAVPIGVLGILFLQMSAVEEDQPGYVEGSSGCVNRPGEAFSDKPGEITAVIEMRVSKHNFPDRSWIDGKALPVELAQLSRTLKQSAVDHETPVFIVEEVLGASYGAGAPEACECQQRLCFNGRRAQAAAPARLLHSTGRA